MIISILSFGLVAVVTVTFLAVMLRIWRGFPKRGQENSNDSVFFHGGDSFFCFLVGKARVNASPEKNMSVVKSSEDQATSYL